MSGPRDPRTVTLTDAALTDLREIGAHSRDVVAEVLRVLKRLAAGRVQPVPLRDFAKTGDLGDCGKILVLVPGRPEYRIVVRDLGGGRFDVTEVVVVGARTGDLAYLLAGLRLGRITDPVRRSDARRRVERLRRALRGDDDPTRGSAAR